MVRVRKGFDGTAADGIVSAAKVQPVVMRFDADTTYFSFELFGTADKLVFGTARGEADPSGHVYFFVLNNGEFAFNTKQMVIDATALAADTDGPEGPLFDEYAVVNAARVTAYNIRFLGGDAGDQYVSGIGSDTAIMGGGDDYIRIGTGTDFVNGGAGDDYMDSTDGSFHADDTFYGGRGRDQLTYYNQNLMDADFENMRSVEILGPSGAKADLQLDVFAQRAGIEQLFVDSFYERFIKVGAGFTGPLFINHLGAVGPVLTLDASKSTSTITIQAGYNSTVEAPTYIGGMGSEDTILISNGYIYEGSPEYGGDLTNIRGFEHVVVEDLGGDSGAFLVLDTNKGEIASDVQTVDATALNETKVFDLQATEARASLHVTSGSGNDTLFAGSGADWISGGGGADIIDGGRGADVFAYGTVADSSGETLDTIRRFVSGADTVDVTGLGGSLSGAEIAFFGNQKGSGGDTAFAKTANDGVLDAVFRSDTHTLWFDTNDDGALDSGDLHMVLTGVTRLTGADVLDGGVVI